ncbi:hypothetical protein DDE18_03685 [Nocardioides gansuensis]|uniref:WD40 repeat domain-containing protein n=1 Tax=Nocardioides gansuensis TaxID=2138300 RepID=A0A2T8FG81_9ACTN|nr:hypothetical protein [Nocardioides gansuensis]PVG84709.1 hypothetical protein DDE18_03685 [Nocardioides gansuensis]
MNTHDELERELAATLRGRVDHLADAPLTLHDVTGKARSIRRNRRLATGAGLLAAAAVIVPVAIFSGGDARRAEEPMPVTPVPTPVAEQVVLSPDAPVGEAPRVAWIEGRTIHLPDGTTIATERPYVSVHLVAGDVLAVWNDDETGFKRMDELDESGEVLASTPMEGPVVANEDGSVIAYALGGEHGPIQVRTAEATTTIEADVPYGMLTAVNGADGCPDGCAIYYSAPGPEGGMGRVDLDGNVTRPVTDVLSISDAHGDRLVAGLTAADSIELTFCSAVFEGGARKWETCETSLEAFSPDGAWVMASDAYQDGAGQSMVAILDTGSGGRQVQYDAGDGFVNYRIWEDATHLLVAHHSFADGLWRLYRVGLDGSVEQAAEPRKSPDYAESPFILVEQ